MQRPLAAPAGAPGRLDNARRPAQTSERETAQLVFKALSAGGGPLPSSTSDVYMVLSGPGARLSIVLVRYFETRVHAV